MSELRIGLIRCKEIESIREDTKSGKFIIRGVAASTAIVHEDWEPEMFPWDVLKRDAHTLKGKPLLDGHSEWPYRVKIQDYIGEITEVTTHDEDELVRFEAEVWNENAKEVARRKLVEHFSVGYGMKSHIDEERDGLRVADEIGFEHLGFLDNPADIKSVMEEVLERSKKGTQPEYVAPDSLPCPDGICDVARFRGRIHLTNGLDVAKRDGKWGTHTVEDIEESLKKLRSSIGKRYVSKTDGKWCVYSKDGERINCYDIDKFGDEEAHQKALKQLGAIEASIADEGRANGEGPYSAGPGGKCVCPECGYETEHERNESCTDMKCPTCNIALVRDGVADRDDNYILTANEPLGHAHTVYLDNKGNGTSTIQDGHQHMVDNFSVFQVDDHTHQLSTDVSDVPDYAPNRSNTNHSDVGVENTESENEEIGETMPDEKDKEVTEEPETQEPEKPEPTEPVQEEIQEEEESQEEDQEEDEPSKEESEDEENTDEERSAADIISEAIDICEDDGLRSVLELAKARAENPPEIEDKEKLELREKHKKAEEELKKLREEKSKRELEERMRTVMVDKKMFEPAMKDKVRELVSSMDEAQYKNFLEINGGVRAFTTGEKSSTSRGASKKDKNGKYSKKTQEKIEKDRYYQPLN